MDRGKLTLYRGGYSSFARQRAEKAALAEKAAEKQAAERAHLQAFIERFKAKASKAKQAQSRVKRLEKLAPLPPSPARKRRKSTPRPEKPLQPPIIAMEGASVGYGERTVLSGLTLRIADDDRIGLLGQNGNGKSTLVSSLPGVLRPNPARSSARGAMNIAYFAQHQLDELDFRRNPRSPRATEDAAGGRGTGALCGGPAWFWSGEI